MNTIKEVQLELFHLYSTVYSEDRINGRINVIGHIDGIGEIVGSIMKFDNSIICKKVDSPDEEELIEFYLNGFNLSGKAFSSCGYRVNWLLRIENIEKHKRLLSKARLIGV